MEENAAGDGIQSNEILLEEMKKSNVLNEEFLRKYGAPSAAVSVFVYGDAKDLGKKAEIGVEVKHAGGGIDRLDAARILAVGIVSLVEGVQGGDDARGDKER